MKMCKHCGKPKAEGMVKIDKQLNSDFKYSREKAYEFLETIYADKESNIGRIMMIGNWITVVGEHIMRLQNKNRGGTVEKLIKDLNEATRDNIEDHFKKGGYNIMNMKEYKKMKSNPTQRYVS